MKRSSMSARAGSGRERVDGHRKSLAPEGPFASTRVNYEVNMGAIRTRPKPCVHRARTIKIITATTTIVPTKP